MPQATGDGERTREELVGWYLSLFISKKKQPSREKEMIWEREEEINKVNYGGGESRRILTTRRRHLKELKICWILKKGMNQR